MNSQNKDNEAYSRPDDPFEIPDKLIAELSLKAKIPISQNINITAGVLTVNQCMAVQADLLALVREKSNVYVSPVEFTTALYSLLQMGGFLQLPPLPAKQKFVGMDSGWILYQSELHYICQKNGVTARQLARTLSSKIIKYMQKSQQPIHGTLSKRYKEDLSKNPGACTTLCLLYASEIHAMNPDCPLVVKEWLQNHEKERRKAKNQNKNY